MSNSDKAQSLADRMNKLTDKLGLSDELLIEGEDIVEYVEDKTKDVSLYKSEESYADIMNLSLMIDDFKFVRDTLKEVTENARRVQNSVTLELLSEDSENQASLIVSFSELSKAITDAQKLYVLSYKEMSTTLLNLDKIKKAEKYDQKDNQGTVNNNLHVYNTDVASVPEILKRLQEAKK